MVEAHNAKRNLIAGGGIKKFNSAVRMGAMKWSRELAEQAELNVRDCYFHHDQCHDTKNIKASGQSIALFPLDRSNNASKTALEAVDHWFDEYKDATMGNLNGDANSNRKVIGHFTVMVVENNVRVGCAVAQFLNKEYNWQYVYTVCNYATTNKYPGEKYYESGTAASKCVTGKDPKFTNLCSPKEYRGKK